MIPEVDSDVNPLDWWKKQETNFYGLGKLANQCLPQAALMTGLLAQEEIL